MKKNTRKLKKAALLLCSAVLLVCISIGATVAYLTSTKTVTNTFTVGKVEIKLDEAVVDANGNAQGNSRTEVGNTNYKLLPGHTYTKDPTVTVKAGSEECYVKMTVTFDKIAALDTIFDPDGADLMSIFGNYDANTWTYKGYTDGSDTRTYEFWYATTVDQSSATTDLALKPLFSNITVPSFITNDQLKTIDGMHITVKAYAIQADGFKDNGGAQAAWGANVNWNA